MFPLPVSIVRDTCKFEQGESQCRYLAESTLITGKFNCLKIVPHLANVIDGEVSALQERYRTSGKQVGSFPIGNNCDGFQIMEAR